MTYSTAVVRLQSVIAVLLGLALGAAPMPILAAEPEPAAEPAEGDVVPPPEGTEAPAEGEAAPAEPATDDENPVAAEQASDDELPSKAEPKPEPKKEKKAKPKKERKKVDPLWLSGVVVAAAGYASVVISIGLAAGMGVRFERGKDANKAIPTTTRPEDEDRRIDTYGNGARANESARKLGIAAAVVFGLGVIMIGTGHGLIARANKKKKNRAHLTPTFGPGHAGLSYGMRF